MLTLSVSLSQLRVCACARTERNVVVVAVATAAASQRPLKDSRDMGWQSQQEKKNFGAKAIILF